MSDARCIQAEAMRAATAIQLAALDHRDADIQVILSGLDADTLRAVIAGLAHVYLIAVRFGPVRVSEMRTAVAADALAQAIL